MYADPRARMLKSMRYKYNQQQHYTRTAFLKSTQHCISHWCQHLQDCNCLEPGQPKTWATNQTIMAEQRTFITDLLHRLWSWHWIKQQHPTTLQVRTLFGENIQLGPPTVKVIGNNDSPIKNLSSIIVFFYHGNEKYKVLCEVADRSRHIVLGRDQASRIKYVYFPQISVQAPNMKPEKTIKAVQKEHVKLATEPVRPVIQQSIDAVSPSMARHTIYLLQKDYADVFKGIGTRCDEEYHDQLKDYRQYNTNHKK